MIRIGMGVLGHCLGLLIGLRKRLCYGTAGFYHFAHVFNIFIHFFTGLGPCLPNNLSTYGARRFHISRSEWDRVFSRLTVVPGLS